MLSKQLGEHGHIVGMLKCNNGFESHGISINALPMFQYSLDCPHLNMTKVEKNSDMKVLLNWLIVEHGVTHNISLLEDGPL